MTYITKQVTPIKWQSQINLSHLSIIHGVKNHNLEYNWPE